MARQRSILVLIVIPAVVSLVVTLLALTLADRQREPQLIMLPTYSSTARIPPRSTQPEPEVEASADATEPPPGDATTEGEAPEENNEGGEAGCENPVHTVEGGQVLGAIAEQYGVSIEDLILLNAQLDPNFSADFLAVGQELVIPVCGIPTPEPTDQPTETAVPTRNVPPPIPTATNPPPGEVEVMITGVRNPGDITGEAVEIVNEGSPVDLDGWTLSGSEGREEFSFPSLGLYSGGGVTIYTGVGENTVIDLYWGLDESVWEIGETVSLYDDDGDLQSEFVIEEEE